MYAGSEDAFLILNDFRLSGISNVTFSHSQPEASKTLLVGNKINRKATGPPTVNCSFSKTYVGKDYINSLTGTVITDGHFQYGTGILNFYDAVISKYTISTAVDGLPKISVNMDIYGGIEPGTISDLTFYIKDEENKIEQISPTGIELTYDNKASAIQSFNYTASFDYVPTYEIGVKGAAKVQLKNPINISSNASLQLLEQEFESVTGSLNLLNEEFFDVAAFIPTAPQGYTNQKSISLQIKGETGNVLDTYSVPQALLQSQNISAAPNDTVNLSLSHLGYMFADY